MALFLDKKQRDAARRLADFLFTPDYLWERLIAAPYDGLPSAMRANPHRIILGTMPDNGFRTRFMITRNWNNIEYHGLIIGLRRIFPTAIPCYPRRIPDHVALEGNDRILYALIERYDPPLNERCCPECGGRGWVIVDNAKPPATEECELCHNPGRMPQPMA